MGKELYFECECGGRAVHRVFDMVDGDNVFDVSSLGQSRFVCEECGKTYYCGDWDEFCWSEDEF